MYKTLREQTQRVTTKNQVLTFNANPKQEKKNKKYQTTTMIFIWKSGQKPIKL